MIALRTVLPLAALLATSAVAQAPSRPTFITLGTGSGPVLDPRRAQPANLLLTGDEAVLIDAGDGATQQLGKAGVPIEKVRTVFISHLHFDHTGGLFALISRRFQLIVPGKLTIYGPPGTRATVDGMLAAMAPAVTTASNIRARAPLPPADTVAVVEIGDGWTGKVGDVTVTAVSNSHYSLQPDTPGNTKKDSYAFRFDMPDRSIVYTGDTGPSPAIEILAKGADILVSEIMDPVVSLAAIKAARPDMSPMALAAIEGHFTRQHLTPRDAGLMAQRAGVKALVLTHNAIPDPDLAAARTAIAASYKGRVTFASDLDRF